MTSPQLTIAIATTAARLSAITPERLPPLPGIAYHVFVQGPAQPSHLDLGRPDIQLCQTEGRGAARNRNAALARVTSPLLLFADDDLRFDPAGLTRLIDRFNAQPQMDFLCARLACEQGLPRKRYTRDGKPVRWWNCGKVGTPELALRPERFRQKGLAFDPRFGAGMPDYLGDEYIFLCDALRAGLRGCHVDETLAQHPRESSGTRHDSAAMAIRKRVLVRALGRWKSRPARLAFALRHWRRFENLASFLEFL